MTPSASDDSTLKVQPHLKPRGLYDYEKKQPMIPPPYDDSTPNVRIHLKPKEQYDYEKLTL